MEEYIKKHMDELYKTGMTTFRDINGEYPDNVVELRVLAQSWVLLKPEYLTNLMIYLGKKELYEAEGSFEQYVDKEIKQLCIDYYGDE